jgi:sulfhydrogenase subunit delta
MKPKIAIYDLTDCEGCEVELVSLGEKLLTLEKHIDILDWRLVQEKKEKGPFDIALIEGCPVTRDEITTLKRLRENSKYLMALGACASLAGIPGILNKKDRAKWYKKIYSAKYKPRGIDALPLSAYVKVDFLLHGCPVDPDEAFRVLEEILAGKKPRYRPYSVCFECKLAGNKCRITEKEKPCLGPITQGGCNAVCVSGGSPCYGCFGVREEANVAGLKQALKKFSPPAELKRYFSMFFNKQNGLQK